MYRKMLIDNIVNHLYEDELLNESDSSSVETLKKDVRTIVEYELRDYKILVGEVY